MTEPPEPTVLVNVVDSILREWEFALDAPSERWPLLRLGERARISPAVRCLVFERDGGCCLSCGDKLTIRTARLDHIIPWSAGGPDTSDNLRILCDPCNVDRSNFRGYLDIHAARRPPVTENCVNCVGYIDFDDDGCEVIVPSPVTPGMVTAYCGWCGVVSRTWPEEIL